jgi:hypothetical protein
LSSFKVGIAPFVSISFFIYEAESPKPRFKLSGKLSGFTILVYETLSLDVIVVNLDFGVPI